MKKRIYAFLCSISTVFILALPISAFAGSFQNKIYTMKLGTFQIVVLQDKATEMSASLFKNADPAVLKQYMPEGKLPASVNTFLVKTGKNVVLIDAGNGERKNNVGDTVELLKKAGVKPSDVDTILITHAHADHVGGLLNGGKAVFPKAKVMFSKAEYASFSDEAVAKLPDNVKGYFMPANTVAKIYKDRIVTFTPGDTVVDGITSVSMPGHTVGNVGYLIESEGQKFFMFGDLLHVAGVQFAHPEYSLVYDGDVSKAVATRKKILKWVSDEKIMIGGVHIPFPGIGMVNKEKSAFSFTPIK